MSQSRTKESRRTLSYTALHSAHKELGGKLVPFANYELPVWFSSIKEEHLAVRNSAGCFDVSHMGILRLSGADAEAFLQKIICNDIAKTHPNKMLYAMILNESGTILDDIMVGKLNSDFYMIINASNREKLLTWFDSYKGDAVLNIEELNSSHSLIAVQGPKSLERFNSAFNTDVSSEKPFTIFNKTLNGVECICMRTGYTGETGIEVIAENTSADAIWRGIIDSGVVPCGLGARDTLRLEAGLPLYGQELSENIHPLMTRYKWVVSFDTQFIGKEKLLAFNDMDDAGQLKTIGFKMEGKAIARQGAEVVGGGSVTSGTLSPSLDAPIGMAMVPKSLCKVGDTIKIKVRGKEESATVVKVPFL